MRSKRLWWFDYHFKNGDILRYFLLKTYTHKPRLYVKAISCWCGTRQTAISTIFTLHGHTSIPYYYIIWFIRTRQKCLHKKNKTRKRHYKLFWLNRANIWIWAPHSEAHLTTKMDFLMLTLQSTLRPHVKCVVPVRRCLATYINNTAQHRYGLVFFI